MIEEALMVADYYTGLEISEEAWCKVRQIWIDYYSTS